MKKQSCHDQDSFAKKTVGELNDKQKDKLINSMSEGFEEVAKGFKYFLTMSGIAAAIAAVSWFINQFLAK